VRTSLAEAAESAGAASQNLWHRAKDLPSGREDQVPPEKGA
jgi:hypothetical protein